MDYDGLVAEVLQELHKRITQDSGEKKKTLAVVGRFSPEEYEPLDGLFQIVPYTHELNPQAVSCVIIQEMSFAMLGNLAMGCGGLGEDFLIHMLLDGKKVYLLEKGLAYRGYKKTAFKPLYNLYSSYEDKLIQYGVTIINSPMDILRSSTDGQEHFLTVYKEEADFSEKKLLLESDLQKRQVKEQSEIKINRKCIVTPLAEDYIKSRSLLVRRV